MIQCKLALFVKFVTTFCFLTVVKEEAWSPNSRQRYSEFFIRLMSRPNTLSSVHFSLYVNVAQDYVNQRLSYTNNVLLFMD